MNVVIFIIGLFFDKTTWFNTFGLHSMDSSYYKPYQWITSMFLHYNISHIVLNMLILYMFGDIVRDKYGDNRFLIGYLLFGFAASYLQLMVSNGYILMMGASGAVYGILVLSAILNPNELVYLMFIIPIRLKWIAFIILLYELYSGFFVQDNIGHFAHLGGSIGGGIFYLTEKYIKK